MKRWLWRSLAGLVLLCGIAIVGYNILLDKAADKISQELSGNEHLMQELERSDAYATPLDEPQQVNDQTNDQTDAVEPNAGEQPSVTGTQQQPTPTPNAQASAGEKDRGQKKNSKPKQNNEQNQNNTTQFKSRQEAVKFVMSRFSASEIGRLSGTSVSDLTPAEKKELKDLAYSRFSPAEIEAVQRAVSQ